MELGLRSPIFVAKKAIKLLFDGGKEAVSQDSPRKDADTIPIPESVITEQITPLHSLVLYLNTVSPR